MADNENHFIKVATNYEQHSAICYHVTRGKEPIKIYQELCIGFVDNRMPKVGLEVGKKVPRRLHRWPIVLVNSFSTYLTAQFAITETLFGNFDQCSTTHLRKILT